MCHVDIVCSVCGGSGWSTFARELDRTFYDDDDAPGLRIIRKGWHDQITQDEVQALADAERLWLWTHDWRNARMYPWVPAVVPTADEVNAAERDRRLDRAWLGHDAINRWILIETRCRRLGEDPRCPACVRRRLWAVNPIEISALDADEGEG